MVHSTLRPHKCTLCTKTFLSTSKLKQHMNVHSGDRPFKCRHCPKDFTNFPNWLKHTRRRHKVDHKTGEKLVVMPNFLNKTNKTNKSNKIKATKRSNKNENRNSGGSNIASDMAGDSELAPQSIELAECIIKEEKKEENCNTIDDGIVGDAEITLDAIKPNGNIVKIGDDTRLTLNTIEMDECVNIDDDVGLPSNMIEPNQCMVNLGDDAEMDLNSIEMDDCLRIDGDDGLTLNTMETEQRTVEVDTGLTLNLIGMDECIVKEENIKSGDKKTIEDLINREILLKQTNDTCTMPFVVTKSGSELSTITVNNRTLPLNTSDDLERAAALLMHQTFDFVDDFEFVNIKSEFIDPIISTDMNNCEQQQQQQHQPDPQQDEQNESNKSLTTPYSLTSDFSNIHYSNSDFMYSYYSQATQCDFAMMPLPPINTVKRKLKGISSTSSIFPPGMTNVL